MFKWFKYGAFALAGMLMAPKKGYELRDDFVDLLKKYRPQLKKLINVLEETWEKSKDNQADEVAANIQMQISEVHDVAIKLDAAKTKEMAYKVLSKLGTATTKIAKQAAASPNVISVAKDIARISLSTLDNSIKVYEKVREASDTFVTSNYQPSDEEILLNNDNDTISNVDPENEKVEELSKVSFKNVKKTQSKNIKE